MTDELHERVAQALHKDWHPEEDWDAIPDSVRGYYRRLAQVALTASGEGEPLHSPDETRDALLPIVAAYVEQQARERAAGELEAAAGAVARWGTETDHANAELLRARAVALRGQA